MTAPTPLLTWDSLRCLDPCPAALDWGRQTYDGRVTIPASTLLRRLIREDKLDWANWLIVRVMTRPQYLRYAIYAAEQGLPLFERQVPGDTRPRQAIEAARACLAHDTPENRRTARRAAEAAGRAAGAAEAAGRAAGWAAEAAGWAAGEAGWAAEAAGWAAGAALQRRILTYGLRLLTEKASR